MPASCTATRAEIVERAGAPLAIAELGSGSGAKTRWILEALAEREPVVYYPIDVSCMALARCQQELAEFGSDRAARRLPIWMACAKWSSRRADGQRLLLLFLGSTIGNFERPAILPFLREVRETLRRGDSLLLGADLVKPVPQMLRAYDDPTGVTAAFNLNLLARINRELGGDFDLRHFVHEARYNRARAPHRNAPQIDAPAAGHHPRCRLHLRVRRGRDHLDRSLPQVPRGGDRGMGQRRRIRLRRAVDRRGVALRREPPAGRMSAIVEFREVTYRIAGRDILCRLSLAIEPGETIVLLGRSGSGKTTALQDGERPAVSHRGRSAGGRQAHDRLGPRARCAGGSATSSRMWACFRTSPWSGTSAWCRAWRAGTSRRFARACWNC